MLKKFNIFLHVSNFFCLLFFNNENGKFFYRDTTGGTRHRTLTLTRTGGFATNTNQ